MLGRIGKGIVGQALAPVGVDLHGRLLLRQRRLGVLGRRPADLLRRAEIELGLRLQIGEAGDVAVKQDLGQLFSRLTYLHIADNKLIIVVGLAPMLTGLTRSFNMRRFGAERKGPQPPRPHPTTQLLTFEKHRTDKFVEIKRLVDN